MQDFDWNIQKNEKLKTERNISFSEIVEAIKQEKIIKIIDHPNQQKYPGQQIFILDINNYVYTVPFVEDEEKLFLKTIIPSRKLTKKFLKK
jgi:uncharacterized DUF497 family protein